MHDNFSESTQFYLDVCDRAADVALSQSEEALLPIERVVLRAYKFGYDFDNGGLSQCFYNIALSRKVAEEMASALDAIGAPFTASRVRFATAIMCPLVEPICGDTMDKYTEAVDPENRLGVWEDEVTDSEEDVLTLLEDFVTLRRAEITILTRL